MKKDPVEMALSQLDGIDVLSPEGITQLAKALKSKYNVVAARAVRIAESGQCSGLIPELVTAFDRFLAGGAAIDKGCAALTAIARALCSLSYDGPELFLKGIRHIQMEASWGKPIDTAAELRAVCAMGLANTRYRNKLRELVPLMVDREWQARSGALKALAAIGSEAASLLLRFKALSGDESSEVVSDCFSALLDVERDDAVTLVQCFAKSSEAEIREAALLSLGSYRSERVVDWLKTRLEQVADARERGSILLALAISRTESANEFLLNLIRTGSAAVSAAVISALEVNRDDPRIRAEIENALLCRKNG